MCFIHFLLCSLILTYWRKNKSTINENVVYIFCIIYSFVFCVFLQGKKKKRGQKEFNLFNLVVGHCYYFVWAYNNHFFMYLQFKLTQTFAFVLTLQNAPAFLRLCSLHSTQNHICHATQNHCQYRIQFKFTKQYHRDHKEYDHLYTYILADKIDCSIQEECWNQNCYSGFGDHGHNCWTKWCQCALK